MTRHRPLELDPSAELPAVRVKSPSPHPWFFRKRIADVAPAVAPGDLVRVAFTNRTGDEETLGYGYCNPRAEIVVRMLARGTAPPTTDAFWEDRLASAVRLRRELLRLDEQSDAWRVIHAEADGLSGFVVDRVGGVLSAEAFSLAFYQRGPALLERLGQILGTQHARLQAGPQVHGQEGFQAPSWESPGCPDTVVVQEHGTRFRVDFRSGHKTGFFCDQRENRVRFAAFCAGKRVLDLCAYTGGFALQARKLGQAAAVTAVEIDEEPLQLARANAALNQCRIEFVRADVFPYMRDMIQNGRRYDCVVLDPPKLIRNRKELETGARQHHDLNRLAMQLVEPGGLLLTCSCAGLLSRDEFLRLLTAAARHAHPPSTLAPAAATPQGRSFQILAETGAAADHPVAGDCPETAYLKAFWLRML